MRGVSLVMGAAVALFSAGCGDDSSPGAECGEGTTEVAGKCISLPGPECGEDTFEVGGVCVAIDPDDSDAPTTSASPAEGRFRLLPDGVVLQADELATIYYTTDGTEPTMSSQSAVVAARVAPVDGTPVRFFAVDPAGNTEVEQSLTYVLDNTGPDAVVNLGATVNGTSADVAWINPGDADFLGVLLVRSIGQVSGFSPEGGVFYNDGDTVSGGVVVLSASATTLTDTMPGALVHYSAWAYDDLGNYSTQRDIQALVQLAPQTAMITVDVVSGQVTVSPQPLDLTLSGTTDLTNGIELSLTVNNGAGRTLFGLKGKTSNVSGGTLGLPNFEGEPTIRFGPRGLANGAGRARSMQLVADGPGVTLITFDLELLDNPVLVGGETIYDPVDVDIISQASMPAFNGRTMQGVITPEGDQILQVGRNQPGIFEAELTVGLPPALIVVDPNFETIGGGKGGGGSTEPVSSTAVEIGAGAMFAGLNEGVHWKGTLGEGGGGLSGVSSISVSRVSMTTRQITHRVELATDDAALPVIRGIYLSKDENILAVLVGRARTNESEVWFLDPATLAVFDGDPNVAGDQGVSLPASGLAGAAGWSDATDTLYVGFKDPNGRGGIPQGAIAGGPPQSPISVIDFATFAVSEINLGSPAEANDIVVRDGKIYYLSTDGLMVIPEAGGATIFPDLSAFFTTSLEVAGIAFTKDGSGYYISGNREQGCQGTVLVDTATDTIVDIDGDANNGVTGLPSMCVSPFSRGLSITPY